MSQPVTKYVAKIRTHFISLDGSTPVAEIELYFLNNPGVTETFYSWPQYMAAIDLLRNERPVFFDPQTRTLFTGKETVGEEEID